MIRDKQEGRDCSYIPSFLLVRLVLPWHYLRVHSRCINVMHGYNSILESRLQADEQYTQDGLNLENDEKLIIKSLDLLIIYVYN